MTHSTQILFVCTGNICRSPMAEALFRAEVDRRRTAGVEIASSGTWATAGQPATHEAIWVMSERGIDLAGHRSRPVVAAELARADLIVAMTSVHVRELGGFAPETSPKVRLLKELPLLQVEVASGIAALLEAPRPPARRALDVDDPIGLPLSAYERCAAELEEGVRALAAALFAK